MMWNGGFGMGGMGGVIGVVIMLAVLALIVVGVVLLVRGLSGRQDTARRATRKFRRREVRRPRARCRYLKSATPAARSTGRSFCSGSKTFWAAREGHLSAPTGGPAPRDLPVARGASLSRQRTLKPRSPLGSSSWTLMSVTMAHDGPRRLHAAISSTASLVPS